MNLPSSTTFIVKFYTSSIMFVVFPANLASVALGIRKSSRSISSILLIISYLLLCLSQYTIKHFVPWLCLSPLQASLQYQPFVF